VNPPQINSQSTFIQLTPHFTVLDIWKGFGIDRDMTRSVEQTGETHDASWLATIGHVVSDKLILVVVLTALVGTLLIYWSFGNSETSPWYFILSEGGKALLFTAVISGGAKWYDSQIGFWSNGETD